MAKNEVAKVSQSNGIVPMNEVPDYLKSTAATGLEGLDSSDFKIPRIKLLQPLSPEIRSFQGVAIPGEFWHTSANVSLGSAFTAVACIASKRVIVWAPRDTMGGGILAFSADGKTWASGANESYDIKLKGKRETVKWNTKSSVANSGLLEWGSSDPEDPKSIPAATMIYEYLLYIPSMPELSPVLMGTYKTAINNAKKLNTSLLMLKKPLASVAINIFADEQSDGGNTWHVPNFKLAGYVPLEVYQAASKLGEDYANYQASYTPDEEVEVEISKKSDVLKEDKY